MLNFTIRSFKVSYFIQASKESIFAPSTLVEAYFLVRTLQRKDTGTQILSVPPRKKKNLWNKENIVNSPTGFGQCCLGLWESKIKSPSTELLKSL